MVIIRVARESDIDSIVKITSEAGQGLSTVPKSQAAVEAYVNETAKFISGEAESNRILFVSETNGVVSGLSGIIIKTNDERPFFSFERRTVSRKVVSSYFDPNYEILELSTKFNEFSELGTLFLSKDARGGGIGRLLSLGRLAFIESSRALFKDGLMADIRGWYDENGTSPFWEQFASKFVNVSFEEADKIMNSDNEFLEGSFPVSPIHLSLMGAGAQATVGKPNDRSIGALKLLLGAGFSKSNFCNVLDGGPALECKTSDTVVARTSQNALKVDDVSHCQPCLHFKGRGYDFRALIQPANMSTASISQDVATYFLHSDTSPVSISSCKVSEMSGEIPISNQEA